VTLTVSSLGIRVRDNPAKVAWEAHYSLPELAKLCGLNPRTLRARWLAEFGCTPKQWLMRERILYAGHLAEFGDRTEDIAAQLDYTDASHFTRDFRCFYGMTTHRWRELCRWERWRANGIRLRIERREFHESARMGSPRWQSWA
jgi:AraC-like DNA-binding protein